MARKAATSPPKRLHDAGPSRRPPSRDGNKLAANVADWIVADIAELGWPEGVVLGSEPDLLQRYGISRAVFREAARIVELQHIARMRRGPGGGLIVTAPSVDAIVDAVAVYLFFVKADVDELFEARVAVESAAAEVAPDRLDEGGIDEIRTLVQREGDRTAVVEVVEYGACQRVVAPGAGSAGSG
jgi:DNA-binding FadR family transcriptional regulator